MSNWSPYADGEYKPLAAGSIDGTDTEPHDRGIVRAMHANYVPPDVDTKTDHTLFVGRLPYSLGEDKLHDKFSRYGKLKSVRVIRDIVTGQSKGYGFVEFCRKDDALDAMNESRGLEIDGYRVIVDRAAGHRLKGWAPRRLGGGWGGRKEAGQLRFGGSDRPWKKPIIIQPKGSNMASGRYSEDRSVSSSSRDFERERGKYSSDRDREKYSSHRRDHYSAKEKYQGRGRRDYDDDERGEKERHRSRSYEKEPQSKRYSDRKEEKYDNSDRQYYKDRYDTREVEQPKVRNDDRERHHSRGSDKERRYSRRDEVE